MVAVLDYVHVPIRGERYVLRIHQFAGTVARPADDAHQMPLPIEDLDAVVAGVGHIEQAIGAEAQAARAGQLAQRRSAAAPGSYELSCGTELANAVGLAAFGYVIIPLRVLDNIAHIIERTGAAARRRPDPAH